MIYLQQYIKIQPSKFKLPIKKFKIEEAHIKCTGEQNSKKKIIFKISNFFLLKFVGEKISLNICDLWKISFAPMFKFFFIIFVK